MIAWLAVWSNHFEGGFHFDDIPTIVSNQSIRHLSNIPRFFTTPRISSLEIDSADYRPLLTTWFAIDYWLGGGLKPFVFLSENMLWFLIELLAACALFKLLPGINWFAAGFATLLIAFHPVMADTVNYALQRSTIFGSLAVIAGMAIWIVWPWKLPQKLPFKLKRVPQHGWDEFLRKNFQTLETRYLKIIHFPAALYLWPVIPALLIEPAAVVFAPILLAYVLLFETKRKPRDVIPAAVVCVVYWIFQLFMSRRVGEFTRIPALNYWFTQPWVAMRYLARFFVPLHLSVDTDFAPFAHFWDPLAIAGYLGLAALVALGIFTARREKWRAVSFGIWWFLLALLPGALVPHRVVEADWRMFLPFVGLALVAASLASMALEILEHSRYRIISLSVAGGLALILVAALGWGTFLRNQVWESDSALWMNAIAQSPRNGRALMHYGQTRLAAGNPGAALEYLSRAEVLAPHDPLIQVNLAFAYERLSRVTDSEAHFRRAVAFGPSWSPSYSWYAEWLFSLNRTEQASLFAARALALDPWDMAARRTMMDIMTDAHEWVKLKQFALDTLRLYPGDPDGLRTLQVAQNGIDDVGKAEAVVRTQPNVNNYLALSVLYFETERYQDCIDAAREALKINPDQAEAYANIAAAYHTMGKLDETIAALREEVRLNPNLPSAKANLDFELNARARAAGR